MKKREYEVTLPSSRDSAIDRRDPLPPERVAQIRTRIASGAYDAAAVVDAVARGIKRSGDL